MKVYSQSQEEIEDNYANYKKNKIKSGEIKRRILVDIIPIILLTTYLVFIRSFFSCFYVLSIIFIINIIFEKFYCNLDKKSGTANLDVALLGQRKVELKNYRKVIWITITSVTAAIFVMKIVFLIIVLTSNEIISDLQIQKQLFNSFELYVLNKQSGWLDYFLMIFPTSFLLIWSIVVLTQIQQPQPMLFDDFIEKKSENYIVMVKLLTQISLVSVQIFTVNIFTYVFFLICFTSFLSFLLNKNLRSKVTKIYIKIAKLIGYFKFFGLFLCATDIMLEYEPKEINYRFLGFGSIHTFLSDLKNSPWFILSLGFMMIFNFISSNQLKYEQLRLKILEIRENEVKNAQQQDKESEKGSLRESMNDSIIKPRGKDDREGSINDKQASSNEQIINEFEEKQLTYIPIQQEQIEEKNPSKSQSHQNKQLNDSKLNKMVKKADKWKKKLMSVDLSQTLIYFLQIGSIIVIQRFNNFYSLLLIFWVIQTGFTIRSKYLVITTYLFSIPSLVMTYLPLIYRNIDENFFLLEDTTLTENLGFRKTGEFWIDSIIINAVLFLFFFYAKQVQLKNKKLKKRNKKKKEGVKFGQGKKNKLQKFLLNVNDLSKVSWFTIFAAFFIKYSSFAALFLLYYIPFYKATLINMGLVLLFFLFFTNISTNVIKKIWNKRRKEFDYREVEFMSRYWIISVVYVGFIIQTRYILELVRKMVTISQYQNDILDIIGLNTMPKFIYSNDFGGLTIIWLLFFFITVQQHVYESQIYQKYSHRICEVIQSKDIIQKYWVSFPWFVRICSIFYSIGLIWLSFIVIITILLIFPYNFINTVLLIYSLLIIMNYIVHSKNSKEQNYSSFIYQWTILVILQIFATFTRYSLQLSGYPYFKNCILWEQNDEGWKIWQNFDNNRDIIGLYTQLPLQNMEDMRTKFLPGILIIFFGVMSMSFLSTLSQGQKIVKDGKNIQDIQALKENYQERMSVSSRGKSMLSENSNFSQDLSKIEENRKQEQYNTYYNFVELDIFKEIRWLKYFVNITSKIITHLNTFLILIFAMYFRLALSMLVFIIIYMSYYWILNNTIFDQIDRHRIVEQTFKKLKLFKNKFVDLNDQSNISIFGESLNIQKIKEIELEELSLRINIKKKLWVVSFTFSVICIILTYASQVLLSRWADENLNREVVLEFKWNLFICGFQVTQNDDIINGIVRQIYFYVLIFWLNVIDLKCTNYLIQQNLEVNIQDQQLEINFIVSQVQEAPKQEQPVELHEKNEKHSLAVIGEEFDLEDMQEQQMELVYSQHLIKYLDQYKITRDTLNFNSYIIHEHFSQEKLNKMSNINELDEQKIGDLIKYFESEKDYAYMKIIFGLLRLWERLYVLIMLINSAICTNIFGVFYLLISIYFWIYKEIRLKIKDSSTANVRIVNCTSILILILQYFLLLCSINKYTSVVVLTSDIRIYRSTSLIDHLVTCNKDEQSCKDWKQYLGFGKQNNGAPVDSITFILNSVIVFLIVLFFTFFIYIAKTILKQIEKREAWRYKINQRKLLLNFQMWRSTSYNFIHGIYQGSLLYGHTILTIVILMVSLLNYSLMNLVTLVLCIFFIFKTEFLISQPSSTKQISLIKSFFTLLLFYQMFIVILYMVFQVPFIRGIFNDYTSYFIQQQTSKLKIYGNILTMFFIQILFDFINCIDYEQTLENNNDSSSVASKMISRCICYKVNEERLVAQENKVKNDLNLKLKVKGAMDQLVKWHQIIKQTTKDSSIQDKDSKSQKQIQEEPLQQTQFDKIKFEYHQDVEPTKNQSISAFSKIIFLIKDYIKLGLITIINICEKNKNNFLFLDQANLLNTYLSFSPELVKYTTIQIEDFVKEKTYKLNRIVEYSFEFYNSFYNELQENDFQPQKNYIKDLTDRDKVQKEMKTFLDKDQYVDYKEVIGIEPKCLDRVNLVDSQDYIYLFNVEDATLKFNEKSSFEVVFYSTLLDLFQLIISQWHYVCFVFFVGYYFVNPGLMSIPLPIIVFAYFLLTDGIAKQGIWTLCYFYVSFVIILQFLLQLNGFDEESEELGNDTNLLSNPSSKYQPLYYQQFSMFYEGLLFFMIFFQVILLKKMGVNKEYVMDIENPHMAYFRKKINKTLFYDVSKSLDSDLQRKNTLGQRRTFESYTSTQEQKKIQDNDNIFDDNLGNSIDLGDRAQQYSQSFIEKKIKSISQQDIEAYSIIYNQFEFEIQKNRYYMDVTKKSNFFINFTGRHKKKIGIDLYPWIALVQIIILIYSLVFYSSIDNNQSGGSTGTVNLNSFPNTLIILLFVQVIIIVSERYIAFYINRNPREEDEQEEQYLAKMEQERLQKEKEDLEKMEVLEFPNEDLQSAEDQNIYIEDQPPGPEEEDSPQEGKEENESDDDQISDSEEQGLVEKKPENKEILKPSKISFISKEVFKYFQLVLQILALNWFVFSFLPHPFEYNSVVGANSDNIVVLNQNASYYTVNKYIKIFYLLYAIYFTLSCFQLKIGYKKFKERNKLMENYSSASSVCVSILFSVPFIAQLKVIMDWTFSNTSLDLFQWFKLENLAYIMYTAKCNAINRLSVKPGIKIGSIVKLAMGWCSVILILLLIFGPMLLFSNLNPLSQISNVKNMEYKVGLQIFENGINQQVTSYPLFINDNINDLQTINSTSPIYQKHGAIFNQISDIYNAKQGQFQFFSLSYYSNQDWQATLPSIEKMKESMKSYREKNNTNLQFKIFVSYEVTRNSSDIISIVNQFTYPFNTSDPKMTSKSKQLSEEQIKGIYDNLIDCNSPSVKLPYFTISLIQLVTTAQGNAIGFKPKPYQVINNTKDPLLFIEDSYLYRECEGYNSSNQSMSKDPNDYKTYWMLTGNPILSTLDKKIPLSFYVYSNTYSQNSFGMSITAIYTTVVLVIGQFLKTLFSGDIEYLIYEEIPFPDTLIDIQLAITVARSEDNLKQENIMYYQFIDILRSPEIIKSLTGSYADLQQKRADFIDQVESENKKK